MRMARLLRCERHFVHRSEAGHGLNENQRVLTRARKKFERHFRRVVGYDQGWG